MKNYLIILLYVFSVSLFSITIELSEGGKVEAEIVGISNTQLTVVSNNCILFIAKPLIKSIKNGEEKIALETLEQHSYPEIDITIYDNILKIVEGYIYNQELSEFIQVEVKDVRTEIDHFVQLKNGDVHRGEIQYKKPFLVAPYVLVNNTHKYKLSNVKAYQTKDGYFRTVPTILSGEVFARRVEKGRIDLYSRVDIYYNWDTMGSITTTRYDYFIKDKQPLKKANYKNLKVALSDNPESMRYLKEYKILSFVQGGLAITCIGLFIAGISQIEDDGLTSTGKGLMVGAVLVGNLSWIPHFIRPEKIEQAIKTYNK